MKFIDLFAGIGGFRYGLQKTGQQAECVWSNEWDKYASEVYKKHYGECDTRDIKTVSTSEIPDHNLLCAGFPCQSFSIAGKRLGFEDTRGTMFFEIARIIRDKRPRYILLENVKGLLSHDQGKTFQTILGVLSDLGYEYQWQVLNSKNFGVPQNRERVFIIGNLRETGRPQVFPLTGEIGQTFETRDVAGTLQADYWKRDRTGGYVIKEKPRIGTLRTYENGRGFREMKQSISPTIPARARQDGSGQPVIVALTEQRTEEAKQIRTEYAKQGRDYSPRRGKVLVARADNKIGTVTTSRSQENLLTDGARIRLLTPTECERLQGFPDGWTEGVSDTQRYKQLGNAVTTNVVTEIGKKILTAYE